jgi:hypothetical protein
MTFRIFKKYTPDFFEYGSLIENPPIEPVSIIDQKEEEDTLYLNKEVNP